MNCPFCKSPHVQSRGAGSKEGTKRYQCQNLDGHPDGSNRWFTVDDNNIGDSRYVSQAPKILVYDIETSTMMVEVFGSGKQYIGKSNIVHPWYILSWAAKWLNSGESFGDVVTPDEAVERDDGRVTYSLWEAIDEADIIIGYNLFGFDIPRMNRRFLENGLKRPSHYQVVDLYRTVKNVFDFESNAMDYVAERLQLERKKQNGGWEFWRRATAGSPKDLQEMYSYNVQDLFPTEDIYFELRTWVRNHPKIPLFELDETSEQCNFCGSTDISPTGKLWPSGLNVYQSFRCNTCEGIGRYKTGEVSKEKKKTLTRNLNY